MNATGQLRAALNATPRALPSPGPAGPAAAPPGARDTVHPATLAGCTVLLAATFGLGSYGNLVVFSSFFDPAFRRFRTHFDFLTLSLSLCDLLVCGVTAPMLAFGLLAEAAAAGVPGAFCLAFHLSGSGFVLVSLKTVAVIALRRLRVVLGRQPDRPASLPAALLLALALWAAGFTLAALATLRPARSRPCLPLAGPAGGEGRTVLCLYAVDFALCVAVVSVSYVTIGRALWRNAPGRRGPPGPAPGGARRPGQASHRNPNYDRLRPASAAALAPAKDSRAVLTCVVIVLSALLCCLPLGVALARAAWSGGGGGLLYQLELCGFTLAFGKSGLNPFIYSRKSSGLRRKALGCLRALPPGFWARCRRHRHLCCCRRRHRTRLRALGKGSLDVNRNKSSHHETNSAGVLSPKSRDAGPSPGASAGPGPPGPGSSTPSDTRVEPFYGVSDGSPSRQAGAPDGQPSAASALGSARPLAAVDHGPDDGTAAAAELGAVPSV
ncbi:probable G-protein coupled receptor 75 [Tachyglossus aculeatus]|uniref:probable G-protein coupled receptor 75 n=1 Tax=Tachyglossus aculeatus TaxID=9261 RepID=UPI0018F59709|nr:probable G-protein coupled receptor 75 [Tachyglossus aculeatus]